MRHLDMLFILALAFLCLAPNVSVAGNSHVPSASCNKIASSDLGVPSVWKSSGDSMPPAEMHFFANGVMALRSSYFAKKESVSYFLWEKPDDSELLVLRSCARLPKAFYKFEGSRLGSEVIRVVQRDASITYSSRQEKLIFNNTYFYETLP